MPVVRRIAVVLNSMSSCSETEDLALHQLQQAVVILDVVPFFLKPTTLTIRNTSNTLTQLSYTHSLFIAIQTRFSPCDGRQKKKAKHSKGKLRIIKAEKLIKDARTRTLLG